MNKQELKTLLESLHFDNQYYIEKNKELEKNKKQTEAILARYKNLINIPNTTKDEIYEKTNNLIQSQIREEEQLLKIIERKQNLEKAIEQIEQPYRTLFYLKYVTSLTFDQVADRMNYSSKRIYQLHREGLDVLLDYINKAQNNKDKSSKIKNQLS